MLERPPAHCSRNLSVPQPLTKVGRLSYLPFSWPGQWGYGEGTDWASGELSWKVDPAASGRVALESPYHLRATVPTSAEGILKLVQSSLNAVGSRSALWEDTDSHFFAQATTEWVWGCCEGSSRRAILGLSICLPFPSLGLLWLWIWAIWKWSKPRIGRLFLSPRQSLGPLPWVTSQLPVFPTKYLSLRR